MPLHNLRSLSTYLEVYIDIFAKDGLIAMLIKGHEIDELVAKYCAITGFKNKSEAVRQALTAQISALSEQEALADRVTKIQSRAAAFGIVADSYDAKAFMNDMGRRMMFADASALVAVLKNEPAVPKLLKAMEAARGKLRVSPVVWLEATLAIARTRRDACSAGPATAEDF